MADPFDFSSPENAETLARPSNNVAAEWSQALGDPRVRGALLQFGLNMMQTPSFGDTFASQTGRAIGAAGESVQAGVEEERRQGEAESKNLLRESRATAAEAGARASEARATAAQARADTASSNIGLRQQQLDINRERMNLQQTVRNQMRHNQAQNTYTRFVEGLRKQQLLDQSIKIPSFPEWAVNNGFGDVAEGPISASGVNMSRELTRAQNAIKGGADAEQVRQLYEQRTGQKAPF